MKQKTSEVSSFSYSLTHVAMKVKSYNKDMADPTCLLETIRILKGSRMRQFVSLRVVEWATQ